tara:strand:- start:87 stop:1226 length:1140 start_codon:yes stop_codon:yes gene_type:complete
MPLSKIVANSITDNTITTDQIANTSVHGRRNLVINGSMTIAQRGTSSTSDSYRTVDRTRTNHGGASVTQTQQTLSSGSPYDEGFRYFYRVANTATSSATSANMQMFQFIEAQNIAGSGWQYTSSSSYVTFSAWVRSSLAGTYMFRLRSFDGTAQNYASKFTLAADTWTKITKTVPGNSNLQFDNDTARGLEVNITVHFGTNYTSSSFVDDAWAAFASDSRSDDFDQNWCNTASATFDTTGWQFEVGDKSTPFEHRSYGEELALCQRYYYVRDFGIYDIIAMGHALGNRGGYLLHTPVSMRIKPSVSQGSYIHCWYNNAGSVTAQNGLVAGYMATGDADFNQVYLRADANSTLSGVTYPLGLTMYHSSTQESYVALDSEL